MLEQYKIHRVLRLIRLLSDKPPKTAKELASYLEISPKTAYQYLKLLEEVGYLIDKDMRNAYFLFEPTQTAPSSLVPDELQLLNQLLDAVLADNPLRESLRKKLYLASTLVPLAEDLMDRHMAKIVQQLQAAMTSRCQVELLHYQSASGNTPHNRRVEPLSFQKNHSQLAAFDLEKQEVRHFKVKRIEGLRMLDSPCTFDQHAQPTDLFGLTSESALWATLNMTKRAYRLLVEEFPEAKAYASEVENNTKWPYRFVYQARSPIGIGRFILGLPGEIEVESPIELKAYLRKKVLEYTFTQIVNEPS